MKNKMLIIQLNRIGDTIQTYQAAKQLVAENPGIELHLVTRKNFGQPLEFLLKDVFTRIFYLDRKELFSDRTYDKAFVNINDFVEEINSNNYNGCVNLSFCKTSSYLNSLVETRVKLGTRYNLQAELAIQDQWSQLVYASVMNGNLTPFNLVDLFKRILGAKNSDTLLVNNGVENSEHIMVHPFASDVKKRWGGSKWVEVIYQLLKSNKDLKVTVVGGKNEFEESKRIFNAPILANMTDRLFNWVGKKSIEETYNQLKVSKLFIGHDSMVSHLASVAGTKSLILSLGSVRPNETTSYGFNKFVLTPASGCFPCVLSSKCEHLKCHNDISHQVVTQIANQFINKDEFSMDELYENVASFHMDNVNFYMSQIDNELGQRLAPLIARNDKVEDVFIRFYEVLWNLLLYNKETNRPFPELNKNVAAELSRYMDGLSNLYELSNFATQYCNDILNEAESKSPSTKKIKELSERLIEVDNLCLISRKPFPHLSPMIDYFYVHKGNIEGENIVDVAQHSLIIYHQAANGYAVMYELMQQSINRFLPRNKECEAND